MKNLFIGACCCSVAASCLTAGCARNTGTPQTYGIAVAPVITRVSGLNFETGDEIGLTIVRSTGVYADNVRMTYDGTLFTAADLLWYGEPSDPSSLAAYYPYADAGVPSSFAVASDQSLGIESSDLLAAVKTDVTPTSAAIGMVFRHMMTSVRIVVTNETESAVSSLLLGGTVLEADVDVAAQQVQPCSGAAASEIRAYASTPDQAYEAVIVPQTAALSLTVETEDGMRRSASFASNTFLQGKYYTVSLLIEPDRLVPLLSGEVSDWVAGGALVPDDAGSEGVGEGSGNKPGAEEPGEGQVATGTMECMGDSYPTVVIGQREWMAENLHYEPVDGTAYWFPDSNPVYAAEYGVLYDFDTAQALCPEGWRLPVEADFEALIAELQEPYESFVPLAGLYTKSTERTSGFGTKGYLMGATQGVTASLRKCLLLNAVGGETLSIQEAQAANGVSVRFVRDVKP